MTSEEAGLLKRLDDFLSQSKSSTSICIEKNAVSGYSVTNNLKNPAQGQTLTEALENFLKEIKASPVPGSR